MGKPTFEQVPLELVMRIIEGQTTQQSGRETKVRREIQTLEGRFSLLQGEQCDWRRCYDTLSPDLIGEELMSRVFEVEDAVFTRFQQLAGNDESNAINERNEIGDAMRAVRRLQVEKLNYPDFGPANHSKG